MRGRWRYLPPNIVTSISLLSALTSISESIGGRFESAAWFLVLCVLLDKADGSVARLFKASSRFGVELDSLSDLIAFGVAPAIMVLSILVGQDANHGLEAVLYYRYLVYVGCFFYVLAAALRLAKFNVMATEEATKYFFGLTTTYCGGTLAVFYLTVTRYKLSFVLIQILPVAMFLLGLLMVSRVPLPKPGFTKSRLLNVGIALLFVIFYSFGLLRIYPEVMLVVSSSYVIIGTLVSIARGIRPPSPDDVEDEATDDDSGLDELDAADDRAD